jgi:hypothetical protein
METYRGIEFPGWGDKPPYRLSSGRSMPDFEHVFIDFLAAMEQAMDSACDH